MNKAPLVISLSPNAELDDIQLANSLLVRPKQYHTGEFLDQLTEALQHYFPNGRTYLTNSGRSALYIAIKSLHLEPTDEVLIQAYTCNAVPNPILWAGAIPRYIDIDENTLNLSIASLENNISAHSKVIVVQHTFGYPAHMEKIMDIARKNNLIVIEDCAHALGARIQNTAVGNFGDMAIFSFGRDKIISSVYGGCLLVNSPHLLKTVDYEYQKLGFPSRRWIVQQLVHPNIFRLGLRYYNVASIGKIILEIAKRLHLISRAVTEGEKHGERPQYFPARLPNALAALALRQLEKLDRFQEHRTSIAAYYDEHIDTAAHSIAQLESRSDIVVEPAYLRYTLLVENPNALIQFAKQRGIMLGDWYNSVITPRGTKQTVMGYTAGSCPTAERLTKHSVNLPTHINISTHDAEHIVRVINSFTNVI